MFKAHRWLHHSTLGSRVMKKRRRRRLRVDKTCLAPSERRPDASNGGWRRRGLDCLMCATFAPPRPESGYAVPCRGRPQQDFLRDESSLWYERTRHMQDSQRQIPALALRQKSLNPCKVFPLRPEIFPDGSTFWCCSCFLFFFLTLKPRLE